MYSRNTREEELPASLSSVPEHRGVGKFNLQVNQKHLCMSAQTLPAAQAPSNKPSPEESTAVRAAE